MIRNLIVAGLCGLAALPAHAQPTSTPAVDYERDVLPILSSKCFGCHGPRQAQSGLRLDLRQNALRGGDSGPVIVPGRSDQSLLIKRLVGAAAGLQMPPTGPLDADDIGVLRAWVDAGADMPGNALPTAVADRRTDPAVQHVIDAIVRGDAPAVREALATYPSLAKASDSAGSTLLMHTASAGSLEMMGILLESGADIAARNSRQATALHWAVADPIKVQGLIANGAPVNAKTVEGRTPLHLAAMQPDGAASIQLLLDAGADVNASSVGRVTPLFAAAMANAANTRLLLAHGADPNARAQTGVTPVMFTRDAEVLALLLARGADVRATSKRGDQAILDAASRGDIESVRSLLDAGADVNAVDVRGFTPLLLATAYDRDALPLVRLLLERGADPEATTEGHSAIRLAIRRGNVEMEKLIRDAAAARLAVVATASRSGVNR